MKKKTKQKRKRHNTNKKCPQHCPCTSALKRQLRKLIKEKESLQFQLNELKERYFGRKKKKDQPSDKNQTPKKKGPLFGHPPWFRKKPDHIDEVEVVTPKQCHKCKSDQLEATKIDDEEHIQEDIVLPKRWVKKFVKKVLKCQHCASLVRGQGTDEIPGAYIGPKAKAWANTLRYEIGISQQKIKNMFEQLLDMPFVQGSVVGFEKKLRENGKKLYQGIQEQVQNATSRYADETGWKENGCLRQLWCFCTRLVAFFHIDPSRGGKVVAAIIGKKFRGALVSDFYTGYNRVEGLKQKCIPHLLRLIEKQKKRFHEDKKALRFLEKFKGLSKLIMEVYRRRKSIKDYGVVRADLVGQLKRCLKQSVGVKPLDDWRKRIGGYRKELTTCLFHPSTDSNNNFVERMLRPSVIMRKITFGSRSQKGIQNHAVIMSLLQTAKLNGHAPPQVFHKILVNPKEITIEDLTDPKSSQPSKRKRGPP
jgi:transposase